MLFFDLKDKEKLLDTHLYELRKYLIFSLITFFIIFCINFYFSSYLLKILQKPLLNVLSSYNFIDYPFIVTSLPEGFISYIKVTFYISILLFIPILIWQIVIYLLPVVNKKFRKEIIIVISILAPLLFYLGTFIAYFITFHVIWNLLVNFNLSKNLGLYLKISEYINLALNMILWSGIIFELPILLYTLFRLGFVNYEELKKMRKITILLAFIIAAIITPPDPLSQIIVALILVLLYEITLKVIKNMSKLSN